MSQLAVSQNGLAFRADRPNTDRMNTNSISRRRFAQMLGAGAALSFVRPAHSLAKAQTATLSKPSSTGIVRLSANENPYGPSPKALKEMNDSFGVACRYPFEQNDLLIDKVAKLN